MKKTIILLSSFISMVMLGQHSCGFDKKQAEQDRKYPELKLQRQKIERQLHEKGINNILREYGFISESRNQELRSMSYSANYTGQIYEIPVVVHIIESNSSTDVKVTDEEVMAWIENANKMYATTYGNGFFGEGTGIKESAVIPFKLVLAKRDPNCQATTGIKRYDGSNLQGYAEYGIKDSGSNGVEERDIRTLAPHWPEKSYYNIYVINAFDGNKNPWGLLGWAYGPEAQDWQYDTFMKSALVKSRHNTTLAHEFGHALGLGHPFKGGTTTACPADTGDCTIDNDGVCDTEPTISLLSTRVLPTENDINTCTNKPYEGVQYNIMNYTSQPRKFTEGQRDRALALFFSQKGHLVRSLGAKELENNNINLAGNTCIINGSDNPNANFSIGVTRVQLGDIDVESNSYNGNGNFYNDYTNTCHSVAHTNIIEGKEASITITKPAVNPQYIVAWIDYNDNGIFEDNEKIINSARMEKADVSKPFTFTPPTSAVKEKYLRMRVRGDWSARDACANAQYGEVEDYAVRIVPENWIDPSSPEQPTPPSNESEFNTDRRVGINTANPQATLDIRALPIDELPEGKPQGVLFPNFTTEQRATFRDVAEGTMIFNTTLKCLEIYSNGAWKCLN